MIKILTRPGCAYCPMVATYLRIKGLGFEEEVSYTEPTVPVTIFPDGTKLVGYNIIALSKKANELTKQYAQDTLLA